MRIWAMLLLLAFIGLQFAVCRLLAQSLVLRWAVRSRATCFYKWTQNAKPPTLLDILKIFSTRKSTPQTSTAPKAARWQGARLAWPSRHASGAGKPLRVVSRAKKVESNIGKRSKNQKVPRSRGQGQRRSNLQTLWVYTYSENVYGGISDLGFVQNTQDMGSEYTVGRMGDGRLT